MDTEFVLYEQLKQLAACGVPFHMPGHKRQMAPAPGLPFSVDLTEITGADDLHAAEGILRQAMERTAALFGAARTWYLVNGSTCGNLAAILSCTEYGDELLAAVNCHRSVRHAAELRGLTVHPLELPVLENGQLYGSADPLQILRQLRIYPKTKAVIVTSPTYEGVVSDIGTIARICHEEGKLLIVDQAHGAHFGLFPEGGFPESAVRLGADLVIESAHKTLPSLTQTALLHLTAEGEKHLSQERIEHMLDIVETSSPSYILMSSLDGCTGILQKDGRRLFADWRTRLMDFDTFAESLEFLKIPGHERQKDPEDRERESLRTLVYDYDASKILLSCRGCRLKDGRLLTGALLKELLRAERIEPEMNGPGHVLLMTGAADTPEMMELLKKALYRIEDQILQRENMPTEEERPFTLGTIDSALTKTAAPMYYK